MKRKTRKSIGSETVGGGAVSVTGGSHRPGAPAMSMRACRRWGIDEHASECADETWMRTVLHGTDVRSLAGPAPHARIDEPEALSLRARGTKRWATLVTLLLGAALALATA